MALIGVLKLIGLGLVVETLLGILWMFVSLPLQVCWQMWQQPGLGLLGATSASDGSSLFVTVIGFAMGFFWTIRRRDSGV